MPSFQVVSEQLGTASAVVTTGGSDLAAAHSTFAAGSGALSGTPAEMQYLDFVTQLASAVSTAHDAVGSLSTALQEAATAYQTADRTAATSLSLQP